MKRHFVIAAFAAMLATGASAQTVGVSMALFDDNFLTVLRNGMIDYSKGMNGVSLQVEDAQNDVGKQLSQVQNFVAAGVDAIIVNPVDTDATVALQAAAAAAFRLSMSTASRSISTACRTNRPLSPPMKNSRAPCRRRKSATFEASGQDGCQGRGDDGRAFQPGGAHAHAGYQGCGRHARLQLHQASGGTVRQLVAHARVGPDDQLAFSRMWSSMPSFPTMTRWPSAPSSR